MCKIFVMVEMAVAIENKSIQCDECSEICKVICKHIGNDLKLGPVVITRISMSAMRPCKVSGAVFIAVARETHNLNIYGGPCIIVMVGIDSRR